MTFKFKVDLRHALMIGGFLEQENPRFREKITVGESRGCMAEQFEPTYLGRYAGRTKAPCANRPDLPAIKVKVLDPLSSGKPKGSIQVELLDRFQRLPDGRSIIIN